MWGGGRGGGGRKNKRKKKGYYKRCFFQILADMQVQFLSEVTSFPEV
jgi:hypothetical protein